MVNNINIKIKYNFSDNHVTIGLVAGRELGWRRTGRGCYSQYTGWAESPRTDTRHFDSRRSRTDWCCMDSDIR